MRTSSVILLSLLSASVLAQEDLTQAVAKRLEENRIEGSHLSILGTMVPSITYNFKF